MTIILCIGDCAFLSISLIVHSRYEGGVGAVVTAGHFWRHSGRFDCESVCLRFRMSLVCYSTYLRDVKSVNLFFFRSEVKTVVSPARIGWIRIWRHCLIEILLLFWFSLVFLVIVAFLGLHLLGHFCLTTKLSKISSFLRATSHLA